MKTRRKRIIDPFYLGSPRPATSFLVRHVKIPEKLLAPEK